MKDPRLKKILLVIVYTILLIFLFINIEPVWGGISKVIGILSPLIIGFILAYILNVPYKLLYDHALKNMGTKNKVMLNFKKPLAMIITYVFIFGAIVGVISAIMPNITASLSRLVADIPSYVNRAVLFILKIAKDIDKTFHVDITSNDDFRQMIESLTGTNITTIISKIINWVYPKALSTLMSTATGVYNVIIGIIFSIYLLAEKETLYRGTRNFFRAYLPDRPYYYFRKVVKVSDHKCGKYLTGKIIEILIMGILYFIVFNIIGFHYATLIAFIMTVSGLIPVFGAFIGAIPSALVLLIINPIECLWFLIAFIILQQIDGNILGPKVLGDSVGLSGLWVLVSVIVFGGLFGVLGMIFGVPVFAVIYTLVRDAIDYRYKLKTRHDRTVSV